MANTIPPDGGRRDRFKLRECETRRWVRFAYACDDDRTVHIGDMPPLMAVPEVNAAGQTTIVLDRMVRRGRKR